MKNTPCLTLMALLLCIPGHSQVPGNMNIGTLSPHHWPSPSPSMVRIRGVVWAGMEPQRGVYDFSELNNWITIAGSHGAQVLMTFYGIPTWASGSDGVHPPKDIAYTNEKCQAPLAGVTLPYGNCMWAENVTELMQFLCGTNVQPSSPLVGKCRIHNFEGWNEFNDGGYWSSNYTNQATMENTANMIIQKYCGDCFFLVGNTSAGGLGYSAQYYKVPSVSMRFDTALGQVLDAWHALPNAVLPRAGKNGLSFHGYNARHSVYPFPMPETNISFSSPLCTQYNVPNASCYTDIFDQADAVEDIIETRPWLGSLPIWNTEGGFEWNGDVTDGINPNDANSDLLKQAYVARWILGLASPSKRHSVTVEMNMWYEWDDPCWGTMYSYGIPASSTSCPSIPQYPVGDTPIHSTWVLMTTWLNGAKFSGSCNNSGVIWQCNITKPGYQGRFMWTTERLTSTSVPIGSSYYTQYRDLDGNVYKLNGSNHVTVTNRPILLEP